MNWHKLSKQDFDVEVKRYLDKSSAPYDPDSWEKMNQKLELAAPNSSAHNGRLYELLIVILVLSTFFFWNVTSFSTNTSGYAETSAIESGHLNKSEGTNINIDNNSSNTDSDKTSSSSKPEKEKPLEEDPSTISVPLETDQNSVPAGSNVNNKPTLTTANNTQDLPPRKDRTTISVPLETDQSSIPEAASANDKSISTNVNSTEDLPPKKDRSTISVPLEADRSSIPPGSNANKKQTLTTANNTQDLPTKNAIVSNAKFEETSALETFGTYLTANGPDLNSGDLKEPQERIDGQLLVAIETPPIIKATASPWLIGFGFAPDLSLVGFSEMTKPGTNFAAVVEYQLNKRWGIQSGAGFSKKNYKAAGKDYNPPEGFWYYGVIPDMTDATCDVIDIPINIRYYFKPAISNRFYVSTGLSSYLMLSEDYYYEYDDYNPNFVESWSVRNENQHFFGIYNISAGYQWSIAAQWYLEVEPFIKIPLNGVGFGEVDLWSTGSWFSVKYNFR